MKFHNFLLAPNQNYVFSVKLNLFPPLTCGTWGLINLSMKEPRALSHDEKKAAEAAFNGRPFRESWSKSARAVYEGILSAAGFASDIDESVDNLPMKIEAPEIPIIENAAYATGLLPPVTLGTGLGEESAKQIALRKEAIEAGLLIDVTKMAKGVGFTMAVGITKSLWERNIIESSDVPTDDDPSTRVRDMLLAVRLRLASLEAPVPWVEVPVLFPSEGEQNPQIFPIYALFHKDPIAAECLTLIHPKELSSIQPSPASRTEDDLA